MELPRVKQNSRDDVSRTRIIFRDSIWQFKSWYLRILWLIRMMQSRGGTLIRKVTENMLVRKHGTNPPTFSLGCQFLNLIYRGDTPENLLAVSAHMGNSQSCPSGPVGPTGLGQSSPWRGRATW